MPLLTDTPLVATIEAGDVTPLKRGIGPGSDKHIDTNLLMIRQDSILDFHHKGNRGAIHAELW